MKAKLRKFSLFSLGMSKQEKLKTFLMSSAFFLIVGAYTIAKDLKDAVFVSIVGRSFLPEAKIYSMIVLIPFVLFYSRLVDKMRRYQLVYFYSIVFAILGVLFTYFLGHPTIGIGNTQASSVRVFGWLFYFFVESIPPFLISVFWAFINSINGPAEARKIYPFVIAGSKMGGATTAGLACLMFKVIGSNGSQVISDVASHRFLLGVASLLFICVPIVIYLLMTRVSGYNLHGYEAVYQLEKQRAKEPEKEVTGFLGQAKEWILGMTGGLLMFVRQPYVLGIFGMSFFYEVVNSIFNYQRLGIVHDQALTISGMSSVLYGQRFFVHMFGVFFTLFGTRFLLKRLGERLCLLLVPIIAGSLVFYLLFSYSPHAVFVVFIGLQILNYSFSQPIRESLYIPTVKELKFKSKSWIDAFGTKMAKTTGSSFNILAEKVGPALFLPLHLGVFIGIIIVWLFTAGWLGKRYDRAIANNEVINHSL